MPPQGLDLALISEEMAKVEGAIQSAVSTDDARLKEAALHLIVAGGKRYRPALGVTIYRALGGPRIEEMVPVAAAIELIHTATLIHDDINDRSTTRRGIVTTHRRYGRSRALVAGDFLFARAFGMVGNVDPQVIDIAARACTELAEGEFLQLQYPIGRMTEQTYLRMVSLKTGSLMRAGAEAATVLAKAPPPQVEGMTRYGHAVGVGFQIADDYLDVLGGNGWGKPLGADMLQGKATLVGVHALAQVSGKDRKTLLAAHARNGKGRPYIARAIKIMDRCGSLDHARTVARRYISEAQQELRQLPATPYRRQLDALTTYAVGREV